MCTSMIAASICSASISSRAAAMVGAGPTTSQPRSLSRSAVNGPTTGESSTSSTRRPESSALTAGSAAARSVDESRDDIAVAARDLHLRSGIEHQEAFAVGVRLDLADQVKVDDRRTVDALEAPRVKPLFEILHRLAQDQRIVPRLDAHVVARRVNPLDRVDVYAEDLALVLDVDHLFI